MSDPKLPPELFAERPVRSDFSRRTRRGPPYAVRRLITVLIICALAGFGFYYAWLRPAGPKMPEEIPTIKSDGSYKQRPEQPGGIDIPHQDMQVYQELDNKAAPQTPVEHLLPPPEVPHSSNVVPPTPASAEPAPENLLSPAQAQSRLETTATQPAQPLPAPPPVIPPSAIPQPAAAASPVPASIATLRSAPKPAAQPSLDQVFKDVSNLSDSPKPPDSSTSTAGSATETSGGDTVIQLASLPDKNAAQVTMAKLQSQYASLLGNISLHIVKADLAAKGTYYRIQSMAMSAARAKSLCASIKASNGGCILVR